MQSYKNISVLRNEEQEEDPQKKKRASPPFEGMHKDILMQVIKKMTAKDFVRMCRTCKAVKESIDKSSKIFYQLGNKNLVLLAGRPEDPQPLSAVLHLGSKFRVVQNSTIRFFKFPGIFVSSEPERNEEETITVLQKMNTSSSLVYLCVKQPWKFFDVINLNKVVFFGMTQSIADALKDKNVNQVIVYLSRFHRFESEAFKSLGEKVKIAESPRSFWCSDLNRDPTYIYKNNTFPFLRVLDNVEIMLNERRTVPFEFEAIILKCMHRSQDYPIKELTIPKSIFDRFANPFGEWNVLMDNKVCGFVPPVRKRGAISYAVIVEEDQELHQKSVVLRFGAKSFVEVQHLITEKQREEISKNGIRMIELNPEYLIA